jgi:hypothetical protein
MHFDSREARRSRQDFTESSMPLTIGPNINSYPGAIGSKQADAPGRDPTTNRPAAGAGAGRSQVTDQIDITSITININQTTTAPNNQLQTELSSAIAPLRNGGSAPQPIAEGYFSSPTNFVPTGSGADPSSANSDISITLQILSETGTNTSKAKDQHSPGRADTATTPTAGSAPDNSSYQSIDISI